MNNLLGKKYSKGKVQIILIGGGGAPLSVSGIYCDSTNSVNETIAIGYNASSVADMPPTQVTAVVVLSTSLDQISALDQLYNAHPVQKINLAIEQSLEPLLFAELQTLFNWTGSLGNYFKVDYIV